MSNMSDISEKVKLLLIGAGARGKDAYGNVILGMKEKVLIVAVAEPNPIRLEKLSKDHSIPVERQFTDWKPLLNAGIEADAVLVCTQDKDHKDPAVLAMKKGYHLLLEKPMAENLEDCIEIVKTAKETNRKLMVCHVLRYTGFFRTIFDAIESGKIGKLITLTHRENVSHFHMAHSFVRGNWGNKEKSSPMMLAKCCHDLDLIYWYVGAKCDKLSSFGSLSFYNEENAPVDSAERCCDCKYKYDEKCEFSAYHIYSGRPLLNFAMNSPYMGIISTFAKIRIKSPKFTKFISKFSKNIRRTIPWKEWPTNIITEDLTDEGIEKAIKEGPYGRCVFRCDNNVVDNQMVTMNFKNGVTANLLMHGHSPIEGRSLRIDGTEGVLIGKFFGDENSIQLIKHGSIEREELYNSKFDMSGHGGGDKGIIEAFVELILKIKVAEKSGGDVDFEGLTNAEASFESHLMALISEKARIEQKVISLDKYREFLNGI